MIQTQDDLTSDALHNRNCYTYFLQLKPLINSQIKALLPEFTTVDALLNHEYNAHYPYGDLYSSCIASLETFIEKNPTATIQVLDDLVQAIYHNDNHILEESSDWINDLGAKARPQQPFDSKIKQKIKDKPNTINQQSPHGMGGILSLIHACFSYNFKPQYTTNIPSIKNYSYKDTGDPVEYRFSTQAQRHHGNVRNSPLFKRWLQINAQKNQDDYPICHIYFNNLGLDRNQVDIAGSKEKALTRELHKLENDPNLAVLIITLPAYEGIMRSSDYKKNTDCLSRSAVFNEFLNIAKGTGHKTKIADLKMSPKARKLLFGTSKQEVLILKKLLEQSFRAQGFAKTKSISTAEKQAVWVHFIKYELTKYIIDTIKPKSFNFSCKDSIDRGALSSAYYNLLCSFERNNPISREEFERAIDAAAANVKGRGMNFHRKIIWNAVTVYVNAHVSTLLTDHKKSWLIYWRDMNCPHSRVEELIKIRLRETRGQFQDLPDNEQNRTTKKLGINLLHTVEQLCDHKVGGKRLLLEVIARTSELIHATSKKSINEYKNLACEIQIKHPIFYVVSGLMQLLLGALFYIPSLGYSQKLMYHGLTRTNTGFFAQNRAKLSKEIIEFSEVAVSHCS